MPQGRLLQRLEDKVSAMFVPGNIGIRSPPNSAKTRCHGERPVVFSVGLPTIRIVPPRLLENAGRCNSERRRDRYGALPRVNIRLLHGEQRQRRRPPRDLHSRLAEGHCQRGNAEH